MEKYCLCDLDGIEDIILQAKSHASQIEWSTKIAHAISMENGGGILLDKEKQRMAQDGVDPSARFPIQDSSKRSIMDYYLYSRMKRLKGVVTTAGWLHLFITTKLQCAGTHHFCNLKYNHILTCNTCD